MLAVHESRARGHDFRAQAGALEAHQLLNGTRRADQVCPLLFRDSSLRQVLACESPGQGRRLCEAELRPGDDVHAVALRHLRQVAGVDNVGIARDLGLWTPAEGRHAWSLQLCTYLPRLPETWTHRCAADEGERRFFWQHPHEIPGDEWPETYQQALAMIRERTRPRRWRG